MKFSLNGLGTSERTLMCLHVVLQLPDMRSKTEEKQEIIFSHHSTKRTRTPSMFPEFSSSIITIVGHQVSEETSDKTDMVTTHTHPASCWHLFKNLQLKSTKFHQERTQGITHFSLAKVARSRAINRNTPSLETSSPHPQKKGYSTHTRLTGKAIQHAGPTIGQQLVHRYDPRTNCVTNHRATPASSCCGAALVTGGPKTFVRMSAFCSVRGTKRREMICAVVCDFTHFNVVEKRARFATSFHHCRSTDA